MDGKSKKSMGGGGRAWLLLSYGEARTYGGNLGYEDDPRRVYRYDSFVPNHKQIHEGDIAVVKDDGGLLGLAKICEIQVGPGGKERQSCPECGSYNIWERKTLHPRFRCVKGHLFDTPRSEFADCIKYNAYFGDSFVSTRHGVQNTELKAACPRWNGQLAMQEIDLGGVQEKLVVRFPELSPLVNGENYPTAEEAINGRPLGSYVAKSQDRRPTAVREIKLRRGQRAFRDNLISRYGPRCMVSGCELLDVVEAAHISPYRGPSDHHVENGLLLRSDLHTLFDLNLLGVHPHSLHIRLHPSVHMTSYVELENCELICSQNLYPSLDALRSRWSSFNERLTC